MTPYDATKFLRYAMKAHGCLEAIPMAERHQEAAALVANARSWLDRALEVYYGADALRIEEDPPQFGA